MGFFKVPIPNGLLDIDYRYLVEGINTNDSEAYVRLRDDVELRPTWVSITEDEFLAAFGGARLSVNKNRILADGLDKAIIKAENPKLNKVTFVEADSGEVIQVVPTNQSGIAELHVTATTSGVIRIRAGIPMLSRVNEVEVIAVEN